jgi:hypothetical protein
MPPHTYRMFTSSAYASGNQSGRIPTLSLIRRYEVGTGVRSHEIENRPDLGGHPKTLATGMAVACRIQIAFRSNQRCEKPSAEASSLQSELFGETQKMTIISRPRILRHMSPEAFEGAVHALVAQNSKNSIDRAAAAYTYSGHYVDRCLRGGSNRGTGSIT